MITPARTGREVFRRQIPFKGGALSQGPGKKGKMYLGYILPLPRKLFELFL